MRNEVEYYAEDPSDASRMRICAGYLHQVQGTLRMVELYAPAMVAEELEQLANAIGADGVADRDEACATLMRGSVLLPDYLERLQNGHRDIPIVLMPLLNEIRAARGEEGVHDSVLLAFAPDSVTATEAELDHARGSLSGRNRELLDTVGSAVKEELLRIKDALDLHLRTGGAPEQLQTQANELGAVADTLGMMGLGVARSVVVQQRDALRGVVEGRQQIDENLLLDIAGALLYVDASLDDRSPIWALAAVARTIRARLRTAARWRCWRMKPSPTSPPPASISSRSSKPAGTMPSCRMCRACWVMYPVRCACSIWAPPQTTCVAYSSTSRPS